MDIWDKFFPKKEYFVNDNGIDSLGIDHSDFSIKDELEYQFNRLSNQNKPIDYSLYGNDFSKEFIDEMVNDLEFNKILNEYLIPNEGGYINDPSDKGGETNMGISQKVYPNENIKAINRERANAIYYRDFYKWNGLYKLPYKVRGFIVDYGAPTSPLNAIKTTHKVLGLSPNGNIIGNNTLNTFSQFTDDDYREFTEKYKTEMKNYYTDLTIKNPDNLKFLQGWLNRAERAHLAK